MKKIIAAFDISKFSNSTQDYSLALAQQFPAHLTAVFFEDPEKAGAAGHEVVGATKKEVKRQHKAGQSSEAALIKDFEESCRYAEVAYSVHRDHFLAISELLQKSVYADLLIISINENFQSEKLPTRFIRHLFAEVQCPMLLVPETYEPIEKVILLYDGKPLSVNTIKLFSYLFDSANKLEPEVLTVRNEHEDMHMPNNKLMKDFMKRHYPEATYNVINGEPSEAITEYLKRQPANTMVVLGAQQRNTIMSMFKESMVDILMREVKLPLFVVSK
jgi:hypothetical protein